MKQVWGITIMRVVLGVLFLAHGIDKMKMGLGNVAVWFESIHLPGLVAYLVGPIELIGGVLLIAGLFTRYVSALLAVVMLGAIFTAKLSAGLLNGYELDLALLSIAIFFVLAETPGWSADRWISGSKSDRA
ncbi:MULTISPECIES: DoxX family protein [Paenibacillus]|uniref:DoxX family protein n=1 Tax=Paenibacillus TaxID=44249 RepID=UPI002FE23EB9